MQQKWLVTDSPIQILFFFFFLPFPETRIVTKMSMILQDAWFCGVCQVVGMIQKKLQKKS